jgi:hypothetical protein
MKNKLIISIITTIALIPMILQATNSPERLRIRELEKAVRLQSLSLNATLNDDYVLACKAQKVVNNSAKIVDVQGQIDRQLQYLCAKGFTSVLTH